MSDSSSRLDYVRVISTPIIIIIRFERRNMNFMSSSSNPLAPVPKRRTHRRQFPPKLGRVRNNPFFPFLPLSTFLLPPFTYPHPQFKRSPEVYHPRKCFDFVDAIEKMTP